ncbi:MAG TPA: PIN domain-containing protein [Rhizomicrobium sp.]|jgi:predicted nucleic acid-binding protein
MAANIVVDASFLIALLGKRDNHRDWAIEQAQQHPRPWNTCDAVIAEVFHVLGIGGWQRIVDLLHRKSVISTFSLAENIRPVLALMEKYRDVPMSFADACLVRMTEILAEPLVLTTDADFRVYRRHSRQVVPCALPY